MKNYIDIYTAFIGSGSLKLCEELSELRPSVREHFNSFQAGCESIIKQLIAKAKEQGLIRAGIDDGVIFHFINMGLSYFRHDERYRINMLSDTGFRQEFMALMFKSIFNDHSATV